MICWFETVGNDPSHNRIGCWVAPHKSYSKVGFHVEKENFRRWLAFSICKSDIIPQANWILHNDAFLAPSNTQRK